MVLMAESDNSSACDSVFKSAIFRVIIGLSDNFKVRAPKSRDSKQHKTRRER